MRGSQKLNIILAMIMLLLLINWVFRSGEMDCFNWTDYTTSFGALFANVGINIFVAVGK